MFYPAEEQEALPEQDSVYQNPFTTLSASPSPSPSPAKAKAQSMSVSEILSMFRGIRDLSVIFGQKQKIKLTEVYNILITVLDQNLKVDDLKSFNRHINYRFNSQEMGEDVEMIVNEDEMDRKIIETILSKYAATPERPKQAPYARQQTQVQNMMGQINPAMLQMMQSQKQSDFEEHKALIGHLKEQIESLRQENKSHKQMKSEDYDQAILKVNRLQKDLALMEDERTTMAQKITKLEAQKTRLESVFKSTMKSDKMDLIDEVQMLVRRIEYLEEQAEIRAKNSYLENQEPYLREIQMLKSKLVQEREMRQQIVVKKNAEVSYFKAELDSLLSELSRKVNNKK